jgi:hypothetical protein
VTHIWTTTFSTNVSNKAMHRTKSHTKLSPCMYINVTRKTAGRMFVHRCHYL